MTTQAGYQPLSSIGKLPVEMRSSAPPEPPSKPFSGPPYELKSGQYYCKVPGCSKSAAPFAKNGLNLHLIRRHGLTMEGKAYSGPRPGVRPAPAPPAPPPNLHGILKADEASLLSQAVRILENVKANLSGKLAEMDLLKRKEERLAVIIAHIKEVL